MASPPQRRTQPVASSAILSRARELLSSLEFTQTQLATATLPNDQALHDGRLRLAAASHAAQQIVDYLNHHNPSPQ